MVQQEIKPTRTELIAIKRKIALYDRGYKLLKMKRDGLVLEFFNILSKARDIRSKIIADYKKAEEKLIIATGVDGETIGTAPSHFPEERTQKSPWAAKMSWALLSQQHCKALP